MNYEEYYEDVWNSIGYQEITEEEQYILEDYFAEIIFGLWRLNSNSGLLNPTIAARIVALVHNVKNAK